MSEVAFFAFYLRISFQLDKDVIATPCFLYQNFGGFAICKAKPLIASQVLLENSNKSSGEKQQRMTKSGIFWCRAFGTRRGFSCRVAACMHPF